MRVPKWPGQRETEGRIHHQQLDRSTSKYAFSLLRRGVIRVEIQGRI